MSSAGMQRLLNICKDYAEQHSLHYNGSKSFSTCFKSKTIKFERPNLFLSDLKIPLVSECKYLGITISEKNCDQDIHRQMIKKILTLIYCLEGFRNVLLMLNAIYSRFIV